MERASKTGTLGEQLGIIRARIEQSGEPLLDESALKKELAERRGGSGRSAQEESLLEIARRRLPPEAERRLHHLRSLHEGDRISAGERAELLAFVDRVEQQDAERAAAIVKLARLDRIPVSEVLEELSAKRTGDAD